MVKPYSFPKIKIPAKSFMMQFFSGKKFDDAKLEKGYGSFYLIELNKNCSARLKVQAISHSSGNFTGFLMVFLATDQ